MKASIPKYGAQEFKAGDKGLEKRGASETKKEVKFQDKKVSVGGMGLSSRWTQLTVFFPVFLLFESFKKEKQNQPPVSSIML